MSADPRRSVSGRRAPAGWLPIAIVIVLAGCSGPLDAGTDQSHTLLPVDERNPAIIYNDASGDNWMGEYSILLAAKGGPPLAALIVTSSSYWPDVTSNLNGWTALLGAARASGLQKLPNITVSAAVPLVRPTDGQIDATVPNGSAGAHLIVDLSRKLSLPWRPVSILAGTQLTDIADAYLLDPSVVDRVVVVAALGTYTAPNGAMNAPNGELDPWADWIVAEKFRYVQLSAFYDQSTDVTTAEVANLPPNPLGTWMANKQPNLLTIDTAADQVTVLSEGLPTFAVAVQRAAPDASATFVTTQGPPLLENPDGNVWIVTQIAAPLAMAHLWQLLLDTSLFGP